MSKFKGVKTDNGKNSAKLGIREYLLKYFEYSSVLDCFCGDGFMFDNVWHSADEYTGIDIKKFFTKKRKVICADNLKFLKVESIKKYNIFDIDAYGSPYEQLSIIIKKLENEEPKTVGFSITDGTQIDLRMGRICKGMAEMTELSVNRIKKAHKLHDDLINIVIKNIQKRLKSTIKYSKIATGRTGAGMRYYGFIIAPED